ncbi:peptidylprolyl isomerase [Lewinella cohaerens]|uniref:peptidylprolyl isomerase n=1 Tax=Lewinella cohaerens TaxID=70995 RepID=UPI000365AD80|nr:peptidylprolyl isomerase [Lewinella cohaerens]
MNNTQQASFSLLSFLFIALFWGACVPPQDEEIITTINIDVQDSLFQRISDWQDLRQVEDLYPMLYHPDPTYRYLAARAFGSMDAPDAVDSLARLLGDPVEEVRSIAAFAMGQLGDARALPYLIRGFMQEDTAMVHAMSQRAILEAVGKCGDFPTLEQLSSVTTYTPVDTALLEGQAWGIYRMGLRDLVSPLGTKRMLELGCKPQYPESVQLIAANYLARVPTTFDSLAAPKLRTGFEQSNNADVRMALAIALGKTQRGEALTSLIGQYQKERDYRVKCNILRALSNFPYESCRTLITEALRDRNEHVARRAAQYLLENSTPEDAAQWWRFAKDSLPTPIHLDLYRVANRHLPAYRTEFRDAINFELRQRYINSSSAYEKAMVLRALGEFAWNYRYIFRESQTATDPIVQSAATEALQQIGDRDDFTSFFGLSTRRVTQDLASYFMEAIKSKRPGPVAIASLALRSGKRDYRPYIDSLEVLSRVLNELELPAMVESYNELGQTIDYLNGTATFEPIRPKFNHPIDWKLLTSIGAQPRLSLKTDEGEAVLVLWPDVAPGSVANLAQLTKDGFLKNKAFHRVVPNFVIQGGSPSGDAYGSLDYSIRSEFSPIHYDTEGMLGMASAGRDTEGTQFFITHSPTLHLDGKYTLFGKVEQGMDIIHKIQQGDRILEAKFLKE